MNIEALTELLEINATLLGGFHLVVPLEADELMKTASRNSGLYDFCLPDWEIGFRSYISLINKNESLRIINRLMIRTGTLRLLKRRLSLVEHLKKNSAIAQEKIQKPIFITGSPRTGTTYLFELLSQDPAFRSPLDFEVRNPINEEVNVRIKAASLEHEAIKKNNPEMKSLHEVKADLPAECNLIMGVSLANTLMNDGGPISWINHENLKDAYNFHKATLQSLQYTTHKRRWLLKCPFHLFSLPELLETYPDAQIIYMHRDQTRAMASLLTVYKTHFSRQHEKYLGNNEKEILTWLKAHEYIIERRQTDAGFNKHFHDIRFSDLMSNPWKEINKIYRSTGIDLTQESRYRLEKYMKKKPRFKHGTYRCTLEEFGLDHEFIYKLFTRYNQCYSIAREV